VGLAAGASPMRGRAAWRRTLAVKGGFLTAGNPDWLPPENCGVRREIVPSWRRSLLSGVDAASTDLPRDDSAVPPDRLVRAAAPVVDRLAEQLTGMQAWAFLADHKCRLVRHVVGDPALTAELDARGAFPGARFGEDVVGTNGLGTAVEQRRPFIVVGSEHFRAHESGATTAGAPVRDPVTSRLVGLLNVNCRYELTGGLLLPFVTEFARAIEARLLASGPAAERALLAEFVRASNRRSQAVVALSETVFIANTAALSLLGGVGCEPLRTWAYEAAAASRERTAMLHLGPDLLVTARCRPLLAAGQHPAAVVILTPVAAPAPVSRRARGSPSGDRLRAQIAQARAMRVPVLLRGERGTGKTVLARCLHDRSADSGPLTVLDPAVGGAREDWAGQLRAALAGPSGTVVVQHLEALDRPLAERVAALLAAPQARLAATLTERAGERTGFPALAERFPVVLDVPPLRERAADFPSLVTAIIAEVRPQPPRPRCTPEALAALAAAEWPGNVRQLRQVVATALVRSLSCDITVNDLPGDYACAGHGRRLTKLERLERQMLLAALRDAAWDREAAAQELGISRATIYRKIKRLGIRSTAARVRRPQGTGRP
jgi:sigma-54 dependent transcriptional regulator, acetoin dehydrogenase operon transcriptional activator AcoR